MRNCIIKMRFQNCISTFPMGGGYPPKNIGEFTVTKRLLKLASRGDASAQYRLACCYSDGFSVEQDEVTARKWFQCSADQGYVPAMFRLGESYLNGEGVDQNRIRGVNWLLKATNRGNRDAAALLGSSYLNGRDLPKRPDLGVKWLRIAANRGCVLSMLELGFCYRDGIGLEQNLVKAYVCLNVLEARSKKYETLGLDKQWADGLTKEQFAEALRMSHKMIHGGPLDL
jgi:TPR repeat protein